MLYADKYENHFLNIDCGRARFADFSRFTLNALKSSTTPALTALGPGFDATLQAFSADVVTRTGSGGATQGETASENAQWDAIKAFISRTDKVAVQPAFIDHPEGLKTIYPAKLSGLTQATKGTRLAKLEAYVKALEAAAPTLPAKVGQDARKLFINYRTLADTKDAGQTAVATLIQELGPEAVALCEALWQVHCTALAAYYATPHLAATYFNYGLLPTYKHKPKKGEA